MKEVIVVGAGPTGLTLAWYLSNEYKVTVIDQNKQVGGVHQVKRINNLFSEHGPRIYTTAYVNFISFLYNQLGLDFYSLFTPYNESVFSTAASFIGSLKWHELWALGWAFFTSSSSPTTVQEFVTHHKFTSDTIQLLDRFCRMTDGAGVERYTMKQLLALLNQHALYRIYQPRQPLDQSPLFRVWRNKLENKGVIFHLGERVTGIDVVDKQVKSVSTLQSRYPCDMCVLALPPTHVWNFTHAVGDDFGQWSQATNYDPYICFTMHYAKGARLFLSNSAITDQTPWGLVWIRVSDYWKHSDEVVVSVAITHTNIPGHNKKTANQCTADEMMKEAQEQIYSQQFQNNPKIGIVDKPVKMILSPGVRQENGRWINADTAFIYTKEGYRGPSTEVSGLFHVGTHNGNSPYLFTSLESAMGNALHFCRQYGAPAIMEPFTLTGIALALIFVMVLFILLQYMRRRNGKAHKRHNILNNMPRKHR
jgi:hypothetical protein